MRRLPLLAGLLLLTGSTLFFSGVELDLFDIREVENDIVVTWRARVEDDVTRYELHRRTRYSNNFVLVAEVAARGAGHTYTYRDQVVYKASSETVEYRLDAVLSSEKRQMIREMRTSYTPTAVRRTWGSIKAMFQ